MSAPWEDRNALEALFRVLRGYGVRRFEGGGMVVEFEPDAAPDGPAVVPSDLGAGEPKCPCGHLQDSEHQNGMCIAAACPVSVCHPDATPKPPAV